MQAALAAEHAAVYGYGVVGAWAAEAEEKEVRTAYQAHRARRDALRGAVRGLGGEPVAAAPAYALPYEVTDAARALELATELETRLTAVYADLVAATEGEARRDAAEALREAALRAARWGGEGAAVPFPGLPEQQDREDGRDTGPEVTAGGTTTAEDG
ncbi:ferritin-like domain-containing protein [Streptomyces sp. YIM 98790]|uniref:ferritin-like domain-containing protein n=1 Tax=Streptomyces sp. YIM 98790 TaxID=2689077 RepID=UPI0014079DF9|nr:ferritin-like domain-containing protein [Streptomyces sp. YIM 98790]